MTLIFIHLVYDFSLSLHVYCDKIFRQVHVCFCGCNGSCGQFYKLVC